MGSSGYMTCGLCHECGNCYPRKSTCPLCGATISLDDDACESCGAPVTEGMRTEARERFKQERREELDASFGNVAPTAPAFPSFPTTS